MVRTIVHYAYRGTYYIAKAIMRTHDLIHYIFHIFNLDNAFTHPPSYLPASFYYTFLIEKLLNFQDTKRHLANKINGQPFCRSYLRRLFALSCP